MERNGPLSLTPSSGSKQESGHCLVGGQDQIPRGQEVGVCGDKTPAVQKNNSNNGIYLRQFCRTCFEKKISSFFVDQMTISASTNIL